MGVMVNYQKPVILRRDSEPEVEEVPDDKIPPRLKDDLIALLEKRHVYLDKDLTIWDLTEKLGTNRTYVSRIINKDFGLTFTVFVNNYRVDHAIRLLNGDKHYTVEEIAEMSGFGSANSLYRAFLAKEGTSLTQYRSGLPNNNRHSNGKS
jgi:AraC-like DNA-binding protein